MTPNPKRSGFYLANGNQILWFGKSPTSKKNEWHTPSKPGPHSACEFTPCAQQPMSWKPIESPEHKAQLAALTLVVPTQEQRIQNAFDAVRSSRFYAPMQIERHPALYFQPGQSVLIGNLDNCKILCESEKTPGIYAVEYDRVENNYGNPIRSTGQIGAWAWYDIHPKVDARKSIGDDQYMTLSKKLRMTSSSLSWACRLLLEGELTSEMAYQREYVWSQADKEKFIRSVINSRPIGALVIGKSTGRSPYQLIDGKQRLNTYLQYRAGLFSVDGVFYHELCAPEMRMFDEYQVSTYSVDLSEVTQAEILRIFIFVNDSGVSQTPEHLASVRKMLDDEISKESSNGQQ